MKELQKAFGKWLMDIAKYITTAVIISSIFGGIVDRKFVYIIGAVSVVLTLGLGLLMVYKTETKAYKKKGA